jgi:hypothetical protein
MVIPVPSANPDWDDTDSEEKQPPEIDLNEVGLHETAQQDPSEDM